MSVLTQPRHEPDPRSVESLLARADRYAPDRTCIEDCITILNHYNPGPRCLIHQAQHEQKCRAHAAPAL